jgi:hypothetical protein
MYKYALFMGAIFLLLAFASCSDTQINGPQPIENDQTDFLTTAKGKTDPLAASGFGATVANGWYEEEEIYYIDGGEEVGVSERGDNQIYLIGGNRKYQAQVVLFIPGEPGYSPHWNVNVVHTAPGVTLADILASPYASSHYPEALFDDVEDILDAQDAGMVTIEQPGVVVLCPIVPEKAADAPGNTELSEDFPPFPDTF